MKKIYISISFIATLGLGLIQTSCKKSPLDNLAVSVNTDIMVSPIAIIFENAKRDAINQPTNISITISGKDKDKVISATGDNTYKVQNGFIFLNIAKGSLPTPENPIVFKITGTANGFESFSKDVIITENVEQHLNIKLIENNNLPDGIKELQSNITLANGTFMKDEILKTSTDDNTKQATTLTIPSGTKIIDTKGDTIKGNQLAVNIRYFNPRSEAIEVFPGGLNPQDVLNKDGKKINGGVRFYSSGLMHIQMRSGDKIVKNFSKPVSAEMEIHSAQDNPITGEPMKKGDKIPLWSRNDETGQWKSEGEATVFDRNGKLYATFEMNHLSSWNLDHFDYSELTKKSLKIIFERTNKTSTEDNYNEGSNLLITMYSKGGTRLASSYEDFVFNGSTSTINNVPNVQAVYFTIHDYLTNKTLTTEVIDPRTKGTMKIDLNYFDDKELITVNFKYNIKCTSNKNLKPNSGSFIIITDLDKNLKFSYRLKPITAKNSDGNLQFKLVNNRNYKIETVGLDGKVISYKQHFNVDNLSNPILDGFTVDKLLYNKSKNAIDVEITYTTPKC